MQNSEKFIIYDIIIVGLMAAMVFVVTFFIKIEFPTPAGMTMLKVGNVVCLLSALLFGELRGGLSAGIGSMFFDLLNPKYVSSAPFTLIFFFLMAYICGKIAYSGQKCGNDVKANVLGASLGAITYVTLNTSKSVIILMLSGSAFIPAIAANAVSIVTSSINAVVAVTLSVVLFPVLKKALTKAGIYEKLGW